jgi:hypothetical protein
MFGEGVGSFGSFFDVLWIEICTQFSKVLTTDWYCGWLEVDGAFSIRL